MSAPILCQGLGGSEIVIRGSFLCVGLVCMRSGPFVTSSCISFSSLGHHTIMSAFSHHSDALMPIMLTAEYVTSHTVWDDDVILIQRKSL